MVLTVLSLRKGKEFERSPAIQGPIRNLKNLFAFLYFDQKALSRLLFTNCIDALLLNKKSFRNGRKRDV